MSHDPLATENVGWTISHVPTGRDSDAEDALESLVRWDKKNAGHHTQKRSSDRVDYQAILPVRATVSTIADDGVVSEEAVCFEIWGRNVSSSGISCLSFSELMPRMAVDDDAGILQVDRFLEEGSHITIGLTGEAGKITYVLGEIVRVRELANHILEFGIRFVSKSGSIF